jgi:hypothetical protein
MGGFYCASFLFGAQSVSSIFAVKKIPHLSDDETVAKMGHPVRYGFRLISELLQERSLFELDLGFFWGDDYGGGYFVLAVEVE